MSWVRIDDRYVHHPKILAAGPIAMALDVAGMCYAASHETDGRIPAAALGLLTPFLSKPKALAAAAKLVEVGRWETTPTGWQIHDFLAYNPSAADRAQRREQNAERVRKHRNAKRDGNALPPRSRNAVRNTTPRPHPLPTGGGDGDPPKSPHPQAPPSPASPEPSHGADSAGETHPQPALIVASGDPGDPPNGQVIPITAMLDATLGPNWRPTKPVVTAQDQADLEAEHARKLAEFEAKFAHELGLDRPDGATARPPEEPTP